MKKYLINETNTKMEMLNNFKSIFNEWISCDGKITVIINYSNQVIVGESYIKIVKYDDINNKLIFINDNFKLEVFPFLIFYNENLGTIEFLDTSYSKQIMIILNKNNQKNNYLLKLYCSRYNRIIRYEQNLK